MKIRVLLVGLLFVAGSPSLAQQFASDCEVTADAFNTLYAGMSYNRVASLIGCEGDLTSDLKLGNGKIQKYSWNGNGLNSSFATITFMNGSMIGREELGLQ